MAADEAIRRLVETELPRVKERILQTSAWTREGVEAREALFKLLRRLVLLADKTGNTEIQLGVEELIDRAKADLPNYSAGGSIN